MIYSTVQNLKIIPHKRVRSVQNTKLRTIKILLYVFMVCIGNTVPVLGKVFEVTMMMQLFDYFELHHLVPGQFRFRTKESATLLYTDYATGS